MLGEGIATLFGKSVDLEDTYELHIFMTYIAMCWGLPSQEVAVKNLPANAGDTRDALSQKDPLKEDMETHSSMIAWRIPWTEETGRLWSRGLQRVGHN